MRTPLNQYNVIYFTGELNRSYQQHFDIFGRHAEGMKRTEC